MFDNYFTGALIADQCIIAFLCMKKPRKKSSKPFERFYKKQPNKFPSTKYTQQPRPKKPSTSKEDAVSFSNPPKPLPAQPLDPMRLNKYLAHSGICSRRKAADYIKQGEVTVNDAIVREMGHKVQPEDVVRFRGKVIQPARNYVYLLLNKPRNVITTAHDDRGRRTVLDFTDHLTKERIYPIGRLDRNTTGLLLLTNDGDFAQKLAHPKFKVKKVYKATLDRPLAAEDFERIKNTLQLEDGPATVDAIAYGHRPNVIGVELHIGRNRIVRRIFEHLNYDVVKLDRVGYGALTKKNLPVGKCRLLTEQERIILQHLA